MSISNKEIEEKRILELEAELVDGMFKMKLHTVMEVNSQGYTMEIIRVATGWIYNFPNGEAIFVPQTRLFTP